MTSLVPHRPFCFRKPKMKDWPPLTGSRVAFLPREIIKGLTALDPFHLGIGTNSLPMLIIHAGIHRVTEPFRPHNLHRQRYVVVVLVVFSTGWYRVGMDG